MSELIELDDRRRAALGRVGNPEHRRYLVDTLPDGTIVFRPAVLMTEAQARLLANPEVMGVVDRQAAEFRADPSVASRGRGIPERRS